MDPFCNYQILPATLGDATQIARVHIQSWLETYRGLLSDDYLDNLEKNEGQRRQKMWAQYTEANDPPTLFVAKDTHVVGFIHVGKSRDKEPVADGEIYAIYLLKSHQGKGIGRALFEKGSGVLSGMGMDTFSLWVAKGNPTEGFYRRMGGVADREITDGCGTPHAIQVVRYAFRAS